MFKHSPHTSNSPIVRALLVLFGIGCIAGGPAVVAQTNVMDSDPLRARKLIVYDMIGAYAGPSFNSQGGSFSSDCDCQFTGGAATGFVGGFMFEKLTRSGLQWGVMAGYENRSVEGRFREIEGVVQQAPSTGQSFTVPIEFLNVGSLSLHFLTATPYLKATFFNTLYVRGGAALSYVFSSNLTHTKSLESDSVTFPNGETAAVVIPGSPSGSVVLQDGPLADLNPIQVALNIGIGAELRLSKKFFLSPVLQYVYPFTSVSSAGDGVSVRAFQFLVEGRLIL